MGAIAPTERFPTPIFSSCHSVSPFLIKCKVLATFVATWLYTTVNLSACGALAMTEAVLSSSAVELLYRQKFSLRSPLPARQHSVWKIEVGVVRTFTILEDGMAITTGLWGPGDVIGRRLSTVEPYHIECLTPVEASPIFLESSQLLGEWLMAHLQQAEALMVIRSYRRVDTMLIKLLGWLAKRFGRAVEADSLIDLRLTHQDFAELLGTTRVTVTRILGQFEEQGLIQRLSLHRILLRERDFWHYEI